MEFEWDERRDASNLEKHGIDFEFAKDIFAGPTLEKTADRRDYGEERIIAIGVVGGRGLVVVYTKRGEARRLISARTAHATERRAYHQKFAELGSPE
jgi:uncharacterized DUF497 family protein